MAVKPDPPIGVNSWLEEELYRQYLLDRSAVDESWKEVFDSSGASAAPAPPPTAAKASAAAPSKAALEPPAGGQLQPLRGAAGRIAENMAASVAIPLATSQRTIAVKVMDENRRIINQHRAVLGLSKVSYTHLIGWALVKALEAMPSLNQAYAEKDGAAYRVVHPHINLGVAVDAAGKDGARNLLVPNIKDAGTLNFQEYLNSFDDLVARARTGKLVTADFQGTTISLTNPGTVGTMSSSPRLMPGQGAIIATGAIDYPAEYHGTAAETRALLGISKVMTLTCTYDHRIIQGAESGAFLGRVQALLDGQDSFYEEIFDHLRIPHQPVHWETDRRPRLARRRFHAHRRDRQGSRHHADDQRLPRARSSHRRPRPARPRAQLSRRARPGNLRRSPSGIWTANSLPAAWAQPSAKPAPSRSPPCARFWRRCAKPTAAKSAAST